MPMIGSFPLLIYDLMADFHLLKLKQN